MSLSGMAFGMYQTAQPIELVSPSTIKIAAELLANQFPVVWIRIRALRRHLRLCRIANIQK
jgi:hypothetical protein